MGRSRLAGLLIGGVLVSQMTTGASAAVPHVVQPGETLWSIAAANNFTTRTVAAYNGLSEDSGIYAGETIQIPTETEGAAALAAAPASSTSPSSSSSTAATGSGVAHVVQPGESLWSIALQDGISEPDLAANN